MRFIKLCFEFINKQAKAKKIKFVSTISIFLGLLYSAPGLADDDKLKPVMSQVHAMFGPGSTFVHLLYLLEVIAGVYAYHKTKNFGVLVGIVVVTIFLTWSLSTYVFV